MWRVKGFTMVEVLFSFSLCMFVLTMCIPMLVMLAKSENETREMTDQKIQELELKLEDLFYPVEDVEWALRLVLS